MRRELVGLLIGATLALSLAIGCALITLTPPPRGAAEASSPTQPQPAVTAKAPAADGARSGDAGKARRTVSFVPDASWIARTSAATSIPARALQAYAAADLRTTAEQPDCEVSWNTIAALGGVESGHGSAGGSVLGADGWPRPAIRGPALDGKQFAAIADTDDGTFDGDPQWDRAVGPLQFIPSTWERWATDGNGDGIADPNQIDDAALAATRYLCASGDLSDAGTWRQAIFSFNHSDAYVTSIAELANVYAARVA